jgi:hypothetical protein
MKSTVSLSRRTMLKTSGAGVLALSVPLTIAASPASASVADVPALLERGAWSDVVGRDVAVDSGGVLRLVAVDDLSRAGAVAALRGAQDAFVLSLVSSDVELSSGIHTLTHPTLGDVALFISPVGRADGAHRYDVVVDRTVRIAGSGAGHSSPLAAAAAGGLAVILGTPGNAAASRRLRVRARARSVHGRLTARFTFAGADISGLRVRIVKAGKVMAHGDGLVNRAGHATIRLRGRHSGTLTHGRYDLEIDATDRTGRVTTVTRTITVS